MKAEIMREYHRPLELVDAPSGCCFRLTLPGSGFPGPASVH